jgi:hypothetical protein
MAPNMRFKKSIYISASSLSSFPFFVFLTFFRIVIGTLESPDYTLFVSHQHSDGQVCFLSLLSRRVLTTPLLNKSGAFYRVLVSEGRPSSQLTKCLFRQNAVGRRTTKLRRGATIGCPRARCRWAKGGIQFSWRS